MPNPTEILIEKLELKLLFRERVFIKWEDESGTPWTLGSRPNRNKQNLNFFMGVYYDIKGNIHIHFSITISVTIAGRKRKMEMLFIVPPDADFANTSKPHLISDIDDLSRLDASAIHEAEISHSVHIICIQFNLTTKGFVVIKKKDTNTPLKPRGIISTKLICGLESLSNTKTFTVYIKPNDYALMGLEDLRNRLSNTSIPIDIPKINMKEIYIQHTPELMEWKGRDPISLPPPYTENPRLSSKVQVPLPPIISEEVRVPVSPPIISEEVQVPVSPPIIFEEATPLINTIEAAIPETPARTPTSPTSTSLHGIFSPSHEELSGSQISLNDIEEDSEHIEMNFDVDSDEEQLAILNSRELNQQLDNDSKVTQILNSKLSIWMRTFIRINPNVHEHKRLTIKLSVLGRCIRISNVKVFDATLLWCSALLFYDPFDSDPDNIFGLWEKRNSWLISDIARLIQWANRIHHGVELSSLLKHFMKLGDAARTVALDTRCTKDKYYDQKSDCIVCVLAEFSKLGNDSGGSCNISKESKSLSRTSLGGRDSSASKRVKM
ncbi:uncharacterized protein EAF02_011434 [Botrytis sinoallii]|uniref:uncharacterized protein n=1 Tax=Botrytis sinoallii TaxID=1463999 RepID=UPI0019009EDE|nr:uncharacterized protein EAF02_011434 [Botrytis sinoallii]KAF7856175.1 hypothetical protein EAF02_011434 [Botrytis sinoallii]